MQTSRSDITNIESDELAYWKAKLELVLKENAYLKKQNEQIINQNAHLQLRLDLLKEHESILNENYKELENNFEWQTETLKLSEEENQELYSVLDSSLASEEQLIFEFQSVSQFPQDIIAKQDQEFIALKEEMASIKKGLQNQSSEMEGKLNIQKQELEKKIEQRTIELFQNYLDRQERSLEEIKSAFASELLELKESQAIQHLTEELKQIQLDITKQQDHLDKIEEKEEGQRQFLQDEITKYKIEIGIKIEKIENLLESQPIKELVEKLQEKIFVEIEKEQESIDSILAHINLLSEKQNILAEQHQPMYEFHQIKVKRLLEQKAILDDEKSRIFYNTLYKVFSAKLIAAIVLFSELVKHEDTLTDKIGKYTGSMIGATLGSVPILGNVLDSLTSLTIEEYVSAIKGHFQAKKSTRTANSLISLDKAIKVAELVARRLTQKKISYVCESNNEDLEKLATAYARKLYNFIKKGKLLPYREVSVDEKVSVLIAHADNKELQEEDEEISLASGKPKYDQESSKNVSQKKERPRREKVIVRADSATLRKKYDDTHQRVEMTQAYSVTSIERLKKSISDLTRENHDLKNKMTHQESVINSMRNELDNLKNVMSEFQNILLENFPQKLSSGSLKPSSSYSSKLFAHTNVTQTKTKPQPLSNQTKTKRQSLSNASI